jgi:ribose transport system permease protein
MGRLTVAGLPVKGLGRRLPNGLDPRTIIARYGTLVFLVLLVLIFTALNPRFIGLENLLNIIKSISQLAILAAGLTVVLVMLDFDLSISWNATWAGVIAAGFARDYQGTYPAFLIGLAAATVVGLINGLVATKLRVSAFIGTLAMGVILEGAIFWYAQGQTIAFGLPTDFPDLGRAGIFGVRYTILIMLGVLFLLWLMLEHTELGRYMYAIGGNREAARLSGINIDRTRIIGFVICGLCAGIAGVLLSSNFGAGNPAIGGSLLLDGFTAAFLGASVLRGGQFHVFGTLVGAIVLGVLTNGMTFINISFEFQSIAKGVVLIAAVAISALGRRRS